MICDFSLAKSGFNYSILPNSYRFPSQILQFTPFMKQNKTPRNSLELRGLKAGISCWIRTSDPLLRRQLLYPSELRRLVAGSGENITGI